MKVAENIQQIDSKVYPNIKVSGRINTRQGESFQSSLSKTYGALHSRSPSESSPICEQDLYAASTYQELVKLNPASAERFLSSLKTIAPTISRNHGGELGFKAADRVMRSMVREGVITNADYRDIRATSLGRSQIDTDRSSLSTTNLRKLGEGLSDSAIKIKVDGNSVATAAEVQAFKQYERMHPTRIDALSSTGTRATITGGEIIQTNKATPTVSGPQTTGDNSLIPDKQVGGKTGFLWKPVSESDGRLAILLPAGLTGRAIGVQILSPDGNRVLATGRFSGVGNGMREHFRFDRSGGNFPVNSIVKVTLTDGSVGTVLIERPGQRNE